MVGMKFELMHLAPKINYVQSMARIQGFHSEAVSTSRQMEHTLVGLVTLNLMIGISLSEHFAHSTRPQ